MPKPEGFTKIVIIDDTTTDFKLAGEYSPTRIMQYNQIGMYLFEYFKDTLEVIYFFLGDGVFSYKKDYFHLQDTKCKFYINSATSADIASKVKELVGIDIEKPILLFVDYVLHQNKLNNVEGMKKCLELIQEDDLSTYYKVVFTRPELNGNEIKKIININADKMIDYENKTTVNLTMGDNSFVQVTYVRFSEPMQVAKTIRECFKGVQ